MADANLSLGLRRRRRLRAAGVVDRLPPLVPVPAREGRRVVRPRVLDRERRDDVLVVLAVVSLVEPVEVGLQPDGHLVLPTREVADLHRVLAVAVAAVLREHGGNADEHRDEKTNCGEQCCATA